MRILMTNYEFPPLGGGSSPLTRDYARKLVSVGHDVDVVTMGYKGLPKREVVDGINVYRVPSLRRRVEICDTHEMISYVLGALPTVVRLVRTRRYDLNHTHFIIPTGLLSKVVKAVTGLPYIITVHGSDVPGYNPDRFNREHRFIGPLWRSVLRGAERVVSPSHFVAGLVESRFDGHSVDTIPHGFEYQRFNPRLPKERRILVVTRMLPRKGVQHLLAALPKVDLGGFEVEIVGDGPFLPELKRMAEERALKVKFRGWLDNSSTEFRDLYERSAIFAFTSESENFPIVLLEAMSAGQAIVTVDGTGCSEVVGDQAMLVPPNDPDSLAKTLTQLIADDGLRARLGRGARERVERCFSWPAIVHRYLSVYSDIAQKRSGPVRSMAG